MKQKKHQYYDSVFTRDYINLPITFFHHHVFTNPSEQPKRQKNVHMFVYKHNHAEMELLYIKQGKGCLLLGADEEKLSFQAGDLLVINPFELHAGYYDSTVIEQEHLVLDFSLSLIKMPISKQAQEISFGLLTQKIHCNNRITEADPHYRVLADAFLNIYDQTCHGIENEFAFFTRVFSLFSILKTDGYFHPFSKINSSERSRRFIVNVLDYLELHYSEKITTQNAAESIGYSTEHFCRLFKEIFNTQFTVYLKQFRIEKAKQLLPIFPIPEISERCGFSSQSNFARAFRKVTGFSPTDFKRKGQSM